MEDHHVDRPGVEAWQHVKLTGTNRSMSLITPARQALESLGIRRPDGPLRHRAQGQAPSGNASVARDREERLRFVAASGRGGRAGSCVAFGRPGGYGEGDTPDPIPNSAVKTLSADGTAS